MDAPLPRAYFKTIPTLCTFLHNMLLEVQRSTSIRLLCVVFLFVLTAIVYVYRSGHYKAGENNCNEVTTITKSENLIVPFSLFFEAFNDIHANYFLDSGSLMPITEFLLGTFQQL